MLSKRFWVNDIGGPYLRAYLMSFFLGNKILLLIIVSNTLNCHPLRYDCNSGF